MTLLPKFCSNCGAPRKEGAKFCKECGTALSQASPAPAESGASEAINLLPPEPMTGHAEESELLETTLPEQTPGNQETSAPVKEAVAEHEAMPVPINSASTDVIPVHELIELQPVHPPEDLPPLQSGQHVPGGGARRSKKPLVYTGVFLGLVLAGVAGWSLWSGSPSAAPLVYVKDYEMMLQSGKSEPAQATRNWIDIEEDSDSGEKIDLSSDIESGFFQDTPFYSFGQSVEGWIKMNEDGDRIFYLNKLSDDSTASLYYADPRKIMKAGEESTDQGVRIASNLKLDMYDPFQISKSGDFVVYLKNYEEESGGSLYLYNMKEEVLIDHNVSADYVISDDGSTLVYTATPDDETYDLYIKPVSGKGDKVKIDSNVNRIVNYSSDMKTIYYSKSDDDESNLNAQSLYVKKDGKDKQKLISDYSGLESGSSDGQFLYTRTTSATAKLMDYVTDDLASEDSKLTEPAYSDFEHEETYTDYWGYAYTENVIDYDQYYEAADKYTAKLERDSLRSDLKNEELTTTTQQLFMYADGKETEITAELGRVVYADADTKNIIYSKATAESIDKMKLSDVSSAYDVRDRFESQISTSDERYLIAGGGKETVLPEEAQDTYSYTFSNDGKELYFRENEDEDSTGTLVVWEIVDGKLSNRKLIDENVSRMTLVEDTMWYYRDVKDEHGELLTYNNGKKEKIAYDVQLGLSTWYPEDNTVLYVTDYNQKRLTGSLYMKRGSKAVKIADDVNFYNYHTGDELFYISDYRLKNGEGDLWEYRGKEDKKLIDSGVQTMVPIKQGYHF